MKVRRRIQEETRKMLQACSLILTPTAPTTAFRLGEKQDDPIEMYLSDIYTVHANLVGSPAISVPLGLHSNGMPMGAQFMGAHFAEGQLLAMARFLENA
jgi:aspartyl-tRNA(Asn)/glutamyl-tRNA(Gln) amidotransferase subunit A